MISHAHVCVRGLRVNITFAHIQTGLRLMRSLSAILGHFSRNNLILKIKARILSILANSVLPTEISSGTDFFESRITALKLPLIAIKKCTKPKF